MYFCPLRASVPRRLCVKDPSLPAPQRRPSIILVCSTSHQHLALPSCPPLRRHRRLSPSRSATSCRNSPRIGQLMQQELQKVIVGQTRGHRADPRRDLHARPLPAGRRAGPGQDAHGQLDQPDPRRQLQAHPVHARPDALATSPARTSSTKTRPGRREFRFVEGPDLRQHHPGRRDQPHAAQDPGRPAPGHAGARRSPSARRRYNLPDPFFVIATQNPIEQEGTYPLPEAQLDRFMFNIRVDYPIARRGEADPRARPRERDSRS